MRWPDSWKGPYWEPRDMWIGVYWTDETREDIHGVTLYNSHDKAPAMLSPSGGVTPSVRSTRCLLRLPFRSAPDLAD
jgi:hypothetical protein